MEEPLNGLFKSSLFKIFLQRDEHDNLMIENQSQSLSDDKTIILIY